MKMPPLGHMCGKLYNQTAFIDRLIKVKIWIKMSMKKKIFFVYFEKLFGAARWSNYFFQSFSTIIGTSLKLSYKGPYNTEKVKMNKKVENGWKKVVWPAFGCTQHPKLVKIHNKPLEPDQYVCVLLVKNNQSLIWKLFNLQQSTGSNQ